MSEDTRVPFRHGVASGDPLTDRVIIWTALTTDADGPVDAAWTVARDPELRDMVASGEAGSDPDADHTVKVDVSGLEPGSTYHFGFEALGERSPVARTRTLPGPGTDHLRFAVVSCAKYSAGFFNGYRRIAARDDLDFVLHLGDYIYEVSNSPPPSQTPGADIGRKYVPDHECVTLEDYRRRYAHYRLDPDVQSLHLAHPVIATLDDHEFADGAWREGSIEHRPERDGDWATRRAAAFGARWDWHPYRLPDPADPERIFRTLPLGGLADLFIVDTRSRRDEPARGPAMLDPGRSQLGSEQRAWLLTELGGSRARWRLLGNGSVLGHIWDERLPPSTIPGLLKLEMIDEDGSGPDPDQWDGYPAEREGIYRRIAETGTGNVVVLSGDVHVGMANELSIDPADSGQEPVAVEFVTASLTSQNLDDKMGWARGTESAPIARAIVDACPQVRWCDLDNHGYMVVDVTPDRVLAEWWFVDTVLRRDDGESRGAAWMAEWGRPRLVPVA